jgi:AcrR family transcriptional regulator
MGKLMNRDRMSRARQEREDRAKRILEAARAAFMRFPYAEVTLDVIGRQAGVKQGQANLAFRSREELFLTVVRPLLADWYDALDHRLGSSDEPLATSELADLVAGSLAERPELTRLLGSLYTALELHDDGIEVHNFFHWQRRRLLDLGEGVARRMPALDPWDGFDALYRAQLVAAAVHPLNRPIGNLAIDLVVEEHQVFALDLEDEVRRIVSASLGS